MMKCPRCESNKVHVMTKSPVGNVWEVYLCENCHYSWRSTEEIHVHDVFKLNDQIIAAMQMIPPIAPLKAK